MVSANFDYYDDEQDEVMELLLLAEELFQLKPSKITPKNPISGKSHLYFESRDHKKRSNKVRNT